MRSEQFLWERWGGGGEVGDIECFFFFGEGGDSRVSISLSGSL